MRCRARPPLGRRIGRQAVLSKTKAQDDGLRDGTAQARQRVGQEALARTGKLSLADLGLADLPEGLRELTGLRELDLSGNILTRLPVWIGRLTALETLVLRGNRLSALPESLTALTHLKRIDLADNHLAEIPRWLGRLDLESLELGEVDALVLPPVSVTTAGTAAVLDYLRKRDMQSGGPLVARRLPDSSVPRPRRDPAAAAPPPTQIAGADVADLPEPDAGLRPKVLIIAASVAVLAIAGFSAAVLPSGDKHPAAQTGPALASSMAIGNLAPNSDSGPLAPSVGSLAPISPTGTASHSVGSPTASAQTSASASVTATGTSTAAAVKPAACPAALTITSPASGTKITGHLGVTLDITACGLTSGQSGWLFDVDSGDGTYGLDGGGPIVTANGASTFTDAPIGSHGDVNEGVKLTLVLADSACSTALKGMNLQNTYPTSLPSSCRIASQVLVIETY